MWYYRKNYNFYYNRNYRVKIIPKFNYLIINNLENRKELNHKFRNLKNDLFIHFFIHKKWILENFKDNGDNLKWKKLLPKILGLVKEENLLKPNFPKKIYMKPLKNLESLFELKSTSRKNSTGIEYCNASERSNIEYDSSFPFCVF